MAKEAMFAKTTVENEVMCCSRCGECMSVGSGDAQLAHLKQHLLHDAGLRVAAVCANCSHSRVESAGSRMYVCDCPDLQRYGRVMVEGEKVCNLHVARGR